MIERYGSLERALDAVLDDNVRYRRERNEARGRVPAEGAVVLTPEQSAAWQRYQGLGTDLDALETRLRDGTAAIERETARELATVSGANATVLQDRLRVSNLRAEVREVPGQNGAAATRIVHLLNAEGQDQGELRAYATQHWADFMPSLFPVQGGGAGGGTVINPQSGPSGSTQGSSIRTFLEQEQQRGGYIDPLQPRPQGASS